MPHDISEDIYRYLARDWGLKDEVLTDKKCELLRESIPDVRKAYYSDRKIAYEKPEVRRAYLAAFAPRYAYILYHALSRVKQQATQVLGDWDKSDAVMCMLGGGPACELFGLLEWLYETNIRPRYLHVIVFDRENYWRTFHSFLFADLLGQRFKKTLVVPTYESVDFPVPKGKNFDRKRVSYNFAQTALIAESKLLSIVNCLSELADHRGFSCHLRYLTQLAWPEQLVVCADSAAKKRRPRMRWLRDYFNGAPNFQSAELFSGVQEMKCTWLQQAATGKKIYAGSTPKWETGVKRWVYIRKTGP